MHTASLQKAHPQVYQDFFGKHELIYSVPVVIPLRYDNTPEYPSGLRVINKLPLRVYLGVHTSNEPLPTFGTVTYYEGSSKGFITKEAFQYKRHLGILQEKYLRLHPKYKNYQLSFLIEVQQYASLRTWRAILALLSYRSAHIDQIELPDWNMPLAEIQQHPGRTYLHEQASAMATLVPYEPDVLYKLASYSHGGFPYIGFGPQVGQQRRGNEFFPDLPESPPNLFDYTLIYTGIPAFAAGAPVYQAPSSELVTQLTTPTPQARAVQESALQQHLYTDEKKFSTQMANVVAGFSLQFLDSMHLLYQPTHRQEHLDQFLQLLQKKQLLDKFTYGMSDELSPLLDQINGLIPAAKHQAWHRLQPQHTGGSILLTTSLERYRKAISQGLDRPTTNLEDTSQVIYKSREDGIETTGIRLEQDISEGKFSAFVHSGFVKVSKDTSHLAKPSLIDRSKHAILIDMMKKKIAIYGTNMHSTDLPSQTYTAELMALLLRNIGKKITHRQLPIGTYAKQKNELVSKIIVPRQKLMKKYFATDFPLHCHGAGGEFRISLDKDPIGITLIEEVLVEKKHSSP